MNNLYLILDIAAIAGPIALSFDKKVRFVANWKFTFIACLLIAIPFILWDIYFTAEGVWGFNPTYLLGINLFGLPIEEILFFIVVPFSCTFIYECCKHYIPISKTKNLDKAILAILVLYTFFMLMPNLSKMYTLWASIGFILTIIGWIATRSVNYLGPTFLFSMIPFLIMNGILTGFATEKPVVWYNNLENAQLRIGSIPIEDVIYGATLIFTNIFLYEFIKKKWSK